MGKKRKRYFSGTGFLDLLFNTLMCFVVLFALSFLQISKKKVAEQDIQKSKAEFLITVTWEKGFDNDVDTWLEDPLGNLMWFRSKNPSLMHLDRDDRGIYDDRIVLEDGTQIKHDYNQEITSIRGYIAGEWTLNIHLYAMREMKPSTIRVRMDRLNPTVTTILQKDIILSKPWQQITVCRFTMSDKGTILGMNTVFKDLIQDQLHYSGPADEVM